MGEEGGEILDIAPRKRRVQRTEDERRAREEARRALRPAAGVSNAVQMRVQRATHGEGSISRRKRKLLDTKERQREKYARFGEALAEAAAAPAAALTPELYARMGSASRLGQDKSKKSPKTKDQSAIRGAVDDDDDDDDGGDEEDGRRTPTWTPALKRADSMGLASFFSPAGSVPATAEAGPAKSPRPVELPPAAVPTLPAPELQAVAPVSYTHVERTVEVQEQREQLPIFMEEQAIMEAVMHNDVVVLCGATGSGKTTQVPQFLYEAGFGSSARVDRAGAIAVTQPRRVAAAAMARRVRHEMNLRDRTVSYQIRYDSQVTDATRIKFMTDGILLREVQGDFLLRRYSVVILDEAHERNLNTDILVGLLSRIVRLRRQLHDGRRGGTEVADDEALAALGGAAAVADVQPLKLIIMSATLRVSDFVGNARLFAVPPPVLSVEARQFGVDVHFAKTTAPDYLAAAVAKTIKIHDRLPRGHILVFLPTRQDIEAACRELRARLSGGCPARVLPLYSTLAPELQAQVFDDVPAGTRLVVVATNVAETSITIPGVVYVVDSGREKRRVYEHGSGLSRMAVGWTSRASADQRTGRAGRTCPGHCYRLYSSAVFQHEFAEFSPPEILSMPVEGVVLQMKSMSIDHVERFPFPTPPGADALRDAHVLLGQLGALDTGDRLTDLGRAMAWIPVAPRYAKMAALARGKRYLPHVIAVVAALCHHDPLMRTDADRVAAGHDLDAKGAATRKAHAHFRNTDSDLLGTLAAIGAYEHAADKASFCAEYFLNAKVMAEIAQLRAQIGSALRDAFDEPAAAAAVPAAAAAARMLPLSATEAIAVRQVIAAGLVDQIARLDIGRGAAAAGERDAAFRYVTARDGTAAYLDSRSWLRGSARVPEYIAYHELSRADGGSGRAVLSRATAIEPQWLGALGSTLCTFSAALADPAPRYDAALDQVRCTVRVTFGPQAWSLPAQEISYPSGLERTRHFARFLLEGAVLPELAPALRALTGRPQSLTDVSTSSWGAQTKAVALLRALSSRAVATGAALRAAVRADAAYLLPELQQWVQPGLHGRLREGFRALSAAASSSSSAVH